MLILVLVKVSMMMILSPSSVSISIDPVQMAPFIVGASKTYLFILDSICSSSELALKVDRWIDCQKEIEGITWLKFSKLSWCSLVEVSVCIVGKIQWR